MVDLPDFLHASDRPAFVLGAEITTPPVDDEPLAATAALIRDLQRQLRETRARLSHAEAALHDAQQECAGLRQALQAPRPALPEIVVERDITAPRLSALLADGYTLQHAQFMPRVEAPAADERLCVVLRRDQPVPTISGDRPPRAAQQIPAAALALIPDTPVPTAEIPVPDFARQVLRRRDIPADEKAQLLNDHLLNHAAARYQAAAPRHTFTVRPLAQENR